MLGDRNGRLVCSATAVVVLGCAAGHIGHKKNARAEHEHTKRCGHMHAHVHERTLKHLTKQPHRHNKH